MTSQRAFVGSTIALGIAAFLHAIFTWPIQATIAFFAGGILVAFVAEAAVISLGWLAHHIGPKVLGVPLYVLPGWVGAVYVPFRVALLVTEGWVAIGLAAALATAFDLLTDHRGADEGYWAYTDNLPGPRFRGVPWWNFAGWFAVSTVTAALAAPFL